MQQVYQLIFRGFATDPDTGRKRIDANAKVEGMIRGLLVRAGVAVTESSLLMVPTNPDVGKPSQVDKDGILAAADAAGYKTWPNLAITPSHGDLFCGCLNEGVAWGSNAGATHAMIISAEAATFFDQTVVGNMVAALNNPDCKVVGIAMPEIADQVRGGRVANTGVAWEINTLKAAGGFPACAATIGVEEIGPLVTMAQDLGKPFISVVEPAVGATYQLVDPGDSAAGERHRRKIESKIERQGQVATAMGPWAPDLLARLPEFIITQ